MTTERSVILRCDGLGCGERIGGTDEMIATNMAEDGWVALNIEMPKRSTGVAGVSGGVRVLHLCGGCVQKTFGKWLTK